MQKGLKKHILHKIYCKNLHISIICSTFAPAFEKKHISANAKEGWVSG